MSLVKNCRMSVRLAEKVFLYDMDTMYTHIYTYIHGYCIYTTWITYILIYILGWSEKQKSWKMQKARADSKSRHTTDFRTVFEIMIGRFVSCEIGQTYFTESGVRFGTLERPDFRSFS